MDSFRNSSTYSLMKSSNNSIRNFSENVLENHPYFFRNSAYLRSFFSKSTRDSKIFPGIHSKHVFCSFFKVYFNVMLILRIKIYSPILFSKNPKMVFLKTALVLIGSLNHLIKLLKSHFRQNFQPIYGQWELAASLYIAVLALKSNFDGNVCI